MNFVRPSTLEAMYQTLQDIFNFYRIQRPSFTGVTLVPLTLAREQFTPLTDEQLHAKAELLLAGKQQEFIDGKRQQLLDEKNALQRSLDVLESAHIADIEKINNEYDASIIKVEREAVKKGLEQSTVVASKIAELESERIDKIARLNAEYAENSSKIEGEIQDLTERLTLINENYSQLFYNQIVAKAIELKDEQDKIEREVFRYNNGLDEKEKRSVNQLEQVQANLNLKYAEINAFEYSKDQLIEMGYYKDVVDCVCGYFEYAYSDPVRLYMAFAEEKKVAIYLEDYYSSILYLYKTQAGV